MNLPSHYTTIPAGKPFLPELAARLLPGAGSDPGALTRTLVLLPGRRACRALREAFLEHTEGRPTLLPRIRPIGDMDEEELLLCPDTDLPPAIPAARRRLLLAREVMDFERRRQGRDLDAVQAAELAGQLVRLLDEVAREGLDFDGLARLVPQDLQEHWQQTLRFLDIISKRWPEKLAAEGFIDPVDRRNRLLLAVAGRWKNQPPDYPVIAAGSTGSQPATAALLSVIAQLPQGRVVLPGLDKDMPDAEWELVDKTHPQFGLKQLLGKLGRRRGDVEMWGTGELEKNNSSFSISPHLPFSTSLLRTIFQPPSITAKWISAPLPELPNLRLIEAATQQDEARMIAVALREVLDTPARTAALVTPDRELARMVSAQMQRFGVTLDDSAGRPLMGTPPGVLLRLSAEMAAAAAAPATLLALLRHPLTSAGREPAECRRLSRLLELELLRGVRKAPGLKALRDAAHTPALGAFLEDMEKQARPFAVLMAGKSAPLALLMAEHIAFTEWLAGKDMLWAGEAGNRLAAGLADVIAQAELLPDLDPLLYPVLLSTLMSEQVFRPSFGTHPRLHILSPIEARLLHFDRVILGGLNEGTWPALPPADPWMSRPMREAFGLPAPEVAIGQSAHDFWLLAHAPEVLLTRARKVGGAPAVPSRWLVRLSTFVAGKNKTAFDTLQVAARYEAASAMLDAPMVMEALEAPAPNPALALRPREMRVTAIDTWLRDPYMIYARYILGLQKLEALDREPSAADFGTIVHHALERFTHRFRTLPDDAEAQLLACGREAFAEFIDRPAVACLWWPRFEAMTGWLLARERERRGPGVSVQAETKGRWHFDVDGRPFTLTTRIDRIESREDGTATLIDYKTGTLPPKSDFERGLANQLFLEALIATHGVLDPSPGRGVRPEVLEYWKLSGNAERCEIKAVVTAQVAVAEERLYHLIRRFDAAGEPYAAQKNPSLLARHNDYAHLTRRQEWETV